MPGKDFGVLGMNFCLSPFSLSGVIVDKCKEHGIWLDGGELRQLMDWIKAGGQILQQQTQSEIERKKSLEADRKLRERFALYPETNTIDSHFKDMDSPGLIARIIESFFDF